MKRKRLRVLVNCERSGVVRDAFLAEGHHAVSCDLEKSDSPNGTHWQMDALDAIRYAQHDLRPFDLMIGHPPCTYLCNSGVRWLYWRMIARDRSGVIATSARMLNKDRLAKLRIAAKFFALHWAAPIPFLALENPIMHKYARQLIDIGGGPPVSYRPQIIQPWQFGHGETKATCLFLKNLPPLLPTRIVRGRLQRVHLMPPSPDRGRLRSVTYAGIAKAMAKQWGTYVLEQLNK